MAFNVNTLNGGKSPLLRTAAKVISTWTGNIQVGDLVMPNTSGNWVIESCANNESFSSAPIGQVMSIEKGSVFCTVEWINVRGYVTLQYSTVMSRGSTLICANDTSSVTGSATFTTDDNTYVIAVDTGNTQATALLL